MIKGKKKTYYRVLVSALLCATSLHANAPADITSKSTVIPAPHAPLTWELSGQVHPAFSCVGNGKRDRTTIIDQDNSPSRLRVSATKKWGSATMVTTAEVGLKSNNSDDGPTFLDNDAGQQVDLRKVEWQCAMPLVTLALGKGETASDNTAESDLSGTDVAAAGPSVNWMMGSFAFNEGAENGTQRSVSQIWNPYDGLGRAPRIALTTHPDQARGVSLGVSYATRQRADIALKFSRTLGDLQVEAALAACLSQDDANSPLSAQDSPRHGHYSQTDGSISVLHTSGISLGGALAHRDYTKAKKVADLTHHAQMWFAKIGYQRQILPWGKTAVAFNYGENKGSVLDKDSTQTYGVALVQHLEAFNASVYIAGQTFKHSYGDAKIESPPSLGGVIMGMRVKF